MPRVRLDLLVCLTVGVSSGCSSAPDPWAGDSGGPRVLVSFAPLYCFAVNVAGDNAAVRNLLTTSGPHHFNPTDRDVRLLRSADVFFLNGLGLEGEKPELMKKGSGNRNLRLVRLGDRIPPERRLAGSCQHDDDTDHHHDHDHGSDPHVWLSPEYAVYLVEGIRDELKGLDPANSADYDRRAAEYIARLQRLKEDGLALLRDKTDRRIVTFHDSMAYFAQTFGLTVVGVVQKTPGIEPTGKQLSRLLALCADDARPIRVVCVEPQYSNSNAGAELVKLLRHRNVPDPVLVELDPLETVPASELTPDWYEKRMRANLEALARAMR